MSLFVLSFENGTRFFYNNITNELFDENENDVLSQPDKKPTGTKAEVVSPETPVRKTRHVEVLKIQLGLKCNYSCSYCNQAIHVNDSSHTDTEDALEFMEKIKSWVVGHPKRIELWGGEPWLYWKKIKVLMPLLRQRFPYAQFSTVTNGSVLNDEILKIIDDYDFNIAVSHDGPGQFLRGPDPLKDPEKREYLEKLIANRAPKGKFSFNSVMCAGNHNPQEIRDFFYREFGPDVHCDFEGVVNDYSDGDIGLVKEYTVTDYAQLSANVLKGLYDGNLHQTAYFGGRYQNFLQDLQERRQAEVVGQKCGMDRGTHLSVDLKGNVTTCQNTGSTGNYLLGNIYEEKSPELSYSWHWSKRRECSNCPVLHLCRGSCMYLEGDNWSRSCNNEYYTAIPIFFAVMSDITGSRLLTVEGDIIRPEYDIPTA